MTINRQLIIFDLNHVLVKKGTESLRPHVKETLSALLEEPEDYAVGIWASCQKEKVDRLLEKIITIEQQQQLLFTWSNIQCTQLPDFQTTRDLCNVWAEFPEFNDGNTTICVNDAKKVMDQYVKCVKIIPSYEGPRKAKGDTVLLHLKEQLDAAFFV